MSGPFHTPTQSAWQRNGHRTVHHTRDENGLVHARLADLIEGRSGKAYADWLKIGGPEFTAGNKAAALDPFRGYANAISAELPEA